MHRGATGSDRVAVLAGLFAGVCWGIYWLPLRLVEQAGFDAAWAMAIFTALPAILCLPAIWFLRLDYVRGGRALMGGVLGGVAFALAGRVPLRGEVLPHPQGVDLEILDSDVRRIHRLIVRKPASELKA